MRIVRYAVFIVLLAVISGCAINNKTFRTNNLTFEEGQQLIAEGNYELGLQKLEQAAQEEPDNLEIRTVLFRERDEIPGRLVLDADNTLLSGDLENAQIKYQHILDLYPRNERAQEGLEAVKMEQYHIASVEYAKQLLELNDITGAETAVRAVLQENPMQPHARQLIKEINTYIARAENTGLTLKTSFKKPFTIEFRDTELKTVFELMAKTAGINFVFDKDVRQETKISIFVRDNNIEDVLNLILMTNQLEYKILNENSLLIYPNTPAKQKEFQELVVRSFHVAHTDVKQMVAMVRGLVKAKDIYVNEQLNLFIMRDTLEAIRVVERLVTLNDLPEPEVMLQVTVLEIQRQDTFKLGPKLPQSATAAFVPPPGGDLSQVAASVTLQQIKNAGFPGLDSFAVSNEVLIDFAQNITFADLLANPRIRVKNREAAKVHIGTKEPIFTSNVAGGGVSNVVSSTPTYIDIGIKLDVEPIIGLNNDVTMKVGLEVSNDLGSVSGPGGASAIRIGTRNAETLLTLKDGETQVLAGLIEDRDQRAVSGIAGLINIPGLDRLTSNQDVRRQKNEIVLLITPRVVRNINQQTNLESEFHFGTANAVGKLPVTISKTAANSLAITTAGSGRGAASAPSRAGGTFSSSNESQETPNPFARSTDATPMISLQAPPRIALDKEFTVRVGLIGAKPSVTSEMELSYDSDMLEALDGEDNTGTRDLKLGKDGTGKTEQIRFKVISANPGTAEIFIQNIISEDKETSESVEITEPKTAQIVVQ